MRFLVRFLVCPFPVDQLQLFLRQSVEFRIVCQRVMPRPADLEAQLAQQLRSVQAQAAALVGSVNKGM